MLLWLHPLHIKLVWRLSEFAFFVRFTSVAALLFLLKFFEIADLFFREKNKAPFKEDKKMKNYELKKDEVILFRGMVSSMSNWREEKKKSGFNTELILTNFNIVLLTEVKKMFSLILDKRIYKVEDIKTYDEAVQIIRRKNSVDLYLLDGELFLNFEKEKSAKEFCDKATKLRSGYSKFVRAVKKTQKVVKETNEALDIDVVEIAKEAVEFTCEAVAETAKNRNPFVGVASVISGKLKKKEEKKRLALGEEPKEKDCIDKEECTT